MIRLLPLALLVMMFLPTGCGTDHGGCSGDLQGNRCVTPPRVHWTAARVEAAARRYSDAPQLVARLRDPRCRVLANNREALCNALVVKPGQPARRAEVMFYLLYHGSLYPICRGGRHRYPFFPACLHGADRNPD